MDDKLVYDYECREVTPAEAAVLLGGEPKDNPHSADDVCPAWQPFRVIFDRKGRLLLGTDELAHLIAVGEPMDVAIYREPAPAKTKKPKKAKKGESKARSNQVVKPRRKAQPDKPGTGLRQRVMELLRRDYPEVSNAVNWVGVVIGIAGKDATYEDVTKLLAGMDVASEYALYRFARTFQRKGIHLPSVQAAVMMHDQAAQSGVDKVRAFWNRLLDKTDPMAKAVHGKQGGDVLKVVERYWRAAQA